MNNGSEAVGTPTASRRRALVPLLLLGVAAVVFSADQLVKNWVVDHLVEGQTVPVWGELLRWHFVRNPGAAFSFATGSTWIFTILAVAVVVVVLWQIRRLRSVAWALFLGLLLGGVLGNLTDRLTREPGFPQGHVIDFISTPWLWLGFNEAIYNIADIAIVSGMILFILITLVGVSIDARPRSDRDSAGTADAIDPAHPAVDSSDDAHGAEDQAHGTP